MAQEKVLTTVRRFARLVSSEFNVKRIVLFGSYAKGTQRPDSDIDVGVILKRVPKSILDTEARLFRLGRDVDSRIEPVLVDDKKDPSGFWEEISGYCKVAYGGK